MNDPKLDLDAILDRAGEDRVLEDIRDLVAEVRRLRRITTVGITSREMRRSGPGEPLEATVILTGLREWGEVKVRCTAGGPDATAIAGWRAVLRLWDAEPGTVSEEWTAYLERAEHGPPFWNWLNTGKEMASQIATLTVEEFARLVEANRGGERVTAQDAARLLGEGLVPEAEHEKGPSS